LDVVYIAQQPLRTEEPDHSSNNRIGRKANISSAQAPSQSDKDRGLFRNRLWNFAQIRAAMRRFHRRTRTFAFGIKIALNSSEPWEMESDSVYVDAAENMRINTAFFEVDVYVFEVFTQPSH